MIEREGVFMGLFDIFKKKNKTEVKLTIEEQKFNKMWKLWVQEKIETPYAELMTYQSEVNNGGHDQYFFNINNIGMLEKEVSGVEKILPPELKVNFKKAYDAFLVLEEKEDDEKAQEILEECDDVFWENEDKINQLLEEYSKRIEL